MTSAMSSIDGSHTVSSGKNEEAELFQETIHSLTSALHELQRELRDKTIEAEALLSTVHSLSTSLRNADEAYWEKAKECETLDMKLQSVSFLTVDSSSEKKKKKKDKLKRNNNEKTSSKKFPSKKSKKRKKKKKDKKSKPVDLDTDPEASELEEPIEDDDDEEQEEGDDDESEDISEDEEDEDDGEGDEEGDEDRAISIANQSQINIELIPSQQSPTQNEELSAIRQKSMYQIIAERDAARMQTRLLSMRLGDSEKQRKDLQAQLNKSQALIELSYAAHQEDDHDNDDQHRRDQKRALRWLLKDRRISGNDETKNNPANWTMDDLDDLPAEYFAVFKSDADAAAGFTEKQRLEL